jgi:hypothetical protein
MKYYTLACWATSGLTLARFGGGGNISIARDLPFILIDSLKNVKQSILCL